MFIGSIDKQSRIIVAKLLESLNSEEKKIYVGCSGNFTFDRIAAYKGFKVFSNDVSLYSSIIAGIIKNKPFKCKCTNKALQSIFSSWDNTKYTDLIKVMYVSKYGQFEACKNDFQKTMLENYIEKADEFFEGTIKKIEKNKYLEFKIQNYFYGDFKAHLQNADNESVVFLYAPTYKAGYEKLFRFIDESFEYKKPVYDLFDSKEAGAYYRYLLDSKEAAIYSDILYPETEKYISGKIEYVGNRKDVYFYSSIKENHKKYFITETKKEPEKSPHILQPEEELPDNPTLHLVPVKVALVNHYKHFYMSAKVDYSTGGDFALAFLLNKKIFGFASFSKGLGTINTYDILFLHSDFVVPSKIPKLSKLLLYMLRTREAKKIISRYYYHEYQGLQTSVYTNKPVSMKYRSVFEKLKDRCETGKLVYKAEFTNRTLREAFDLWKNQKKIK